METPQDDCLIVGQRLYCAVDIPMAKAGQYLVVVHGVVVGIDLDGKTEPRAPRADECLIPGKRVRLVVNLPPIEAGASLIVVHGVCVDVDTRAPDEHHRSTIPPYGAANQRPKRTPGKYRSWGSKVPRRPTDDMDLVGGKPITRAEYHRLVDGITDSAILALIAASDEPILSQTIGDHLGLPRASTSLRGRVSHRLRILMSNGQITAYGPTTRRLYTIAPPADADAAAQAVSPEADSTEPLLHETV